MKPKHKCKECAEISKWYAKISKNYAKSSKGYAEKCRCEK